VVLYSKQSWKIPGQAYTPKLLEEEKVEEVEGKEKYMEWNDEISMKCFGKVIKMKNHGLDRAFWPTPGVGDFRRTSR